MALRPRELARSFSRLCRFNKSVRAVAIPKFPDRERRPVWSHSHRVLRPGRGAAGRSRPRHCRFTETTLYAGRWLAGDKLAAHCRAAPARSDVGSASERFAVPKTLRRKAALNTCQFPGRCHGCAKLLARGGGVRLGFSQAGQQRARVRFFGLYANSVVRRGRFRVCDALCFAWNVRILRVDAPILSLQCFCASGVCGRKLCLLLRRTGDYGGLLL